jgi:hypothetical protein
MRNTIYRATAQLESGGAAKIAIIDGTVISPLAKASASNDPNRLEVFFRTSNNRLVSFAVRGSENIGADVQSISRISIDAFPK